MFIILNIFKQNEGLVYMAYEDDDDIVSESAEYSPKSEFSKAMHVSESVKLVCENRAKEMKPGYMNSVLDKEGNEVKTWVADTRKIYISSVDALRCLLAPEIRREGKFDEIEAWFNFKRDALWNQYAFEDFGMTRKQINNSSAVSYILKKNGKKHMPEIDDQIKTTMLNGNKPTYDRGGWNASVNAYWIEIVKLYDLHFADLNILIDKLNYFKATINF